MQERKEGTERLEEWRKEKKKLKDWKNEGKRKKNWKIGIMKELKEIGRRQEREEGTEKIGRMQEKE